MEKEFIPYEQALTLKYLGFDEPCFGFYNNADGNVWIKHTVDELIKNIYTGDFEAPTFSQAFRWFREKYGLSHEIHLKMSNNRRKIWYNINELDNRLVKNKYFRNYPKGMFETYEEAELECLKKLIEIVKNNK